MKKMKWGMRRLISLLLVTVLFVLSATCDVEAERYYENNIEVNFEEDSVIEFINADYRFSAQIDTADGENATIGYNTVTIPEDVIELEYTISSNGFSFKIDSMKRGWFFNDEIDPGRPWITNEYVNSQVKETWENEAYFKQWEEPLKQACAGRYICETGTDGATEYYEMAKPDTICFNDGNYYTFQVDAPLQIDSTLIYREAEESVSDSSIPMKILCYPSGSFSFKVEMGECSHTFKEKTEGIPSTCSENGIIDYWTCDYCHKDFSDEACTKEITSESGYVAPLADHLWDDGKEITAPTTEKEGVKIYTCKDCNATKTETIDKIVLEQKKDEPTTPAEQGVSVQTGTTITDTKSGADYQVTDTISKTVQYQSPKKSKNKVTIPATVNVDGVNYKVTSVADGAFSGDKKLVTVTIGKNVTSIGEKAFANCKKLKTVKLQGKVTEISDSAFSGCKKLKTVNLGTKVKTVGDKAFYGCSSLTKVTLPASVQTIGKKVIANCTKLKTIVIKSKKLTKQTVENKAFAGMSKKTIVKVPKNKEKAYQKLFEKKGLSKKITIKGV